MLISDFSGTCASVKETFPPYADDNRVVLHRKVFTAQTQKQEPQFFLILKSVEHMLLLKVQHFSTLRGKTSRQGETPFTLASTA